MIGEGTALLETELGFPIPLLVSFSLFIYHSPLHHRMRFHPCTGRLESYRPVTSAPTLYSNPYSHNQLRTTTKDTLPRALGCSPRWFEPIHKNQITSQS